MRLFVDESCDVAVVCALRAAGHDVTAVVEVAPGANDADVMALAARQDRVVLTEDKDFGQLVYAHGHGIKGVVLLRYPFRARRQLVQDVVRLVRQHGRKLAGCFVVVQPGRVRIGGAPQL